MSGSSTRSTESIWFAVAGDVHGDFEALAVSLEDACQTAGVTQDALAGVFLVGDVEALRTPAEMDMVHGPEKYRKLGTFPDVISGDIELPAEVFFIGGNHEPWAALDADGGLVAHGGAWAPGVTFLGRAGIVEVAGLRVAFLSGIHSPKVSDQPAKNRPLPHNPVKDRQRRNYWVREEVERVMAAGRKRGGVDLLLAHDWPTDIGNSRDGRPIGSLEVRQLIEAVRPTISCHGHHHHRLTTRVAETDVHCLGHISSGYPAAVAVFEREVDGTVTRLA